MRSMLATVTLAAFSIVHMSAVAHSDGPRTVAPTPSAPPNLEPAPTIETPAPTSVISPAPAPETLSNGSTTIVAAELPLPSCAPPVKLWTGSLDFGINGSEGNSQNFNVLANFKAKRDTAAQTLTIDSLYNFANANNDRTANRLLTVARNEWKFANSPYSLFWDGSAEYDEFWAFDMRLATHIGVGYQFWKTNASSLKGRLGSGVSRQIGGNADNRLFPELVVGMDYEQKIDDRQKIVASADYFPDLADFNTYRMQGSLAYEVQVDPEKHLFLKLGLLDRYNTAPQGNKSNDLNYFVTLAWKF